jgi:hypothetical protein
MKITFWRSSGTIDRGPYALVGLIGFTLKHNVDRLVATYVFHRPWGLFNDWIPVRDAARITALHSGDARFLGTMIVLALPFIWVGVALTTKRLRSANLPSRYEERQRFHSELLVRPQFCRCSAPQLRLRLIRLGYPLSPAIPGYPRSDSLRWGWRQRPARLFAGVSTPISVRRHSCKSSWVLDIRQL